MTHTNGPWRIEWEMAHGGSAHRVCDSTDMGGLSVVATVHFHDDTEDETKDNARLIAAAPDLLEALREIARNDPYRQSSAGVIARAAIAKATKKES